MFFYRFAPNLVLISAFGCLTPVQIPAYFNNVITSYGFFFVCAKRRKKHESLLTYISEKAYVFLQIWYVVCLGRQLHSSFGIHQIKDHTITYEFVKIATLLFCLYTHVVCARPFFLGHTSHYHVSWLIITIKACTKETEKVVHIRAIYGLHRATSIS